MFSGMFGFALAILFLTVVAPVWIISHYATKWRTAKTLTATDERHLADMWESAQRLEARIQNLEKILDHEAPGWRSKA